MAEPARDTTKDVQLPEIKSSVQSQGGQPPSGPNQGQGQVSQQPGQPVLYGQPGQQLGQPGQFYPQGRIVNFQPPPQGGPYRPGPGQPQILQPNMLQPNMVQPNMMRPGPPGPGSMPFGNPGQGGYRPGPPPMGYQGGPGQMPNNGGMGNNLNQPLLNGGNDANRFANDNRGLQNVHANVDAGAFGATQTMCGDCQGFLATYLPCCCCCFSNPYEVIMEGYSGIIMRFGRFHKLVGPGMHYLNRDVDTLILIDKRERVIELKQQDVVSKDNIAFRLDAVVFFKVMNSYKSRFGVNDLRLAIQDLAVTTLRNVIGRFTLQEFLQKRDEIADDVQHHVQEPAENWGAKVIRVLVQDVMLPPDARSMFSTSAITKKIAEAQIIQSKADVEAARLMKEAADALNTDAALQIRYIDALENVSKSANPKLIFFPADYKDVGTVNDGLEDEALRLLS